MCDMTHASLIRVVWLMPHAPFVLHNVGVMTSNLADENTHLCVIWLSCLIRMCAMIQAAFVCVRWQMPDVYCTM